jgi:hypothetical protein
MIWFRSASQQPEGDCVWCTQLYRAYGEDFPLKGNGEQQFKPLLPSVLDHESAFQCGRRKFCNVKTDANQGDLLRDVY